MENYFNSHIIERHEDHMWLNNGMAEVYDFCAGVAAKLDNPTDEVWYYQMKKGHLCYDV
jgi:hypothetical protein